MKSHKDKHKSLALMESFSKKKQTRKEDNDTSIIIMRIMSNRPYGSNTSKSLNDAIYLEYI